MNNKDEAVKAIASFITDDPDIFNEMAMSTGAIDAGPGVALPTRKRKKVPKKTSKSYQANPVTGQPKDKGEVLFADTQSEETDEALE